MFTLDDRRSSKDFDRRRYVENQNELIIGDLAPPPPPVSEPKKVRYEKVRDASIDEDGRLANDMIA